MAGKTAQELINTIGMTLTPRNLSLHAYIL
jgi:hypothetical protein